MVFRNLRVAGQGGPKVFAFPLRYPDTEFSGLWGGFLGGCMPQGAVKDVAGYVGFDWFENRNQA
jgi:hypothetical protein